MEVKLYKNVRTITKVQHLTWWKGPIICCPPYDLKFSRTICVIINRGRLESGATAAEAAETAAASMRRAGCGMAAATFTGACVGLKFSFPTTSMLGAHKSENKCL